MPAIIGIILLIVFLVIVGPLLLICGVNWMIEPFDLRVPYTLGTWFGAWLIILIIKGGSSSSS